MFSVLALCVYMKIHGALVKNDLRKAKVRRESSEEFFLLSLLHRSLKSPSTENYNNNRRILLRSLVDFISSY